MFLPFGLGEIMYMRAICNDKYSKFDFTDEQLDLAAVKCDNDEHREGNDYESYGKPYFGIILDFIMLFDCNPGRSFKLFFFLSFLLVSLL